METENIIMQPDREAFILNDRIRANGQTAVTAVCAIGRDLRRMKVEELYTYLGYESFEDYAEQEHGLKRRQAYNYISVYENLGESFVQSNAQLGITKLALLTQVNAEDRTEIMNENDLSEMTVNEVRELLDKVKQQGEQLSMFENQLNDKEEQEKELEARIKELESRAVPEPEIKEVIKKVPDKALIAEKDREISTLKRKNQLLDEARIEETEKLKKSYEERLAQLQKPSEQPENSEKSSFKLLYAEAYKSCLGLVEFIKNSEEQDKELFTEKTDKLLDIIRESLSETGTK